jgi:hypothetical protein
MKEIVLRPVNLEELRDLEQCSRASLFLEAAGAFETQVCPGQYATLVGGWPEGEEPPLEAFPPVAVRQVWAKEPLRRGEFELFLRRSNYRGFFNLKDPRNGHTVVSHTVEQLKALGWVVTTDTRKVRLAVRTIREEE